MLKLYNVILNGELENAISLLRITSIIHPITIFYCVIKMNSRTYKLYKQIVLTNTILNKFKLSFSDKRLILELAIMLNSTYIAKSFLRIGVKPRKHVLSKQLSNNMSKLLDNFNIY